MGPTGTGSALRLPPLADPSRPGPPGKQRPLPLNGKASGPVVAPKGMVVIPSEDGTATVVPEKRTMTIGEGPYEKEIRILTPEERASRRFWRNVVFTVIGLFLLLGLLWAMVNF